jgi:hypothetical protein
MSGRPRFSAIHARPLIPAAPSTMLRMVLLPRFTGEDSARVNFHRRVLNSAKHALPDELILPRETGEGDRPQGGQAPRADIIVSVVFIVNFAQR